jgi:hypothetical protein
VLKLLRAFQVSLLQYLPNAVQSKWKTSRVSWPQPMVPFVLTSVLSRSTAHFSVTFALCQSNTESVQNWHSLLIVPPSAYFDRADLVFPRSFIWFSNDVEVLLKYELNHAVVQLSTNTNYDALHKGETFLYYDNHSAHVQ